MRTLVLALLVAAAVPAHALIGGGGSPARDCWAEFDAGGLALNTPPHDLAKPKPAKDLSCFDGEAGCDLDGTVDGACTFDVDVCLHQTDAALPACTPVEVTGASVKQAGDDPGLAGLQSALAALLPASAPACTDGETLRVPLTPKGKRGKGRVVVSVLTAAGKSKETLRLVCVPREWPSHGHDDANTRASGVETTLSPANAAQLAELWTLDLEAIEGPGANGVTSTPTVKDGRVYVSSWNGNVYALDARNGTVKWRYDAGSPLLGIQSSVTLTADGRALVADGDVKVHCLDAKTGRLLWRTDAVETGEDHVWASPTVSRGMVYVGVASDTDNPCTQGRLVALDLDTGAVRWQRRMVPPRVCRDDTGVACTVDGDCATGTCVYARGAGVTATPAVEAGGRHVYVNTVGCFTSPSMGDSDSIMKLDALTGADVWVTRVTPREQFGSCSSDPGIDCGTTADCPPGDTCTTKAAYHDFGFLNGPLLVPDGSGGILVVSGSKDGTIYALDPDDGGYAWQNAVQPVPITPNFAGFGLFNGAVGYADGRLHAALNELAAPIVGSYERMMAFDALGGGTLWDDPFPRSWGSVGIAGGLVFAGARDVAELFVYDAAAGARLTSLPLPTPASSGPSIVGGVVYAGFGIFDSRGGVRAFALP